MATHIHGIGTDADCAKMRIALVSPESMNHVTLKIRSAFFLKTSS